MPPKETSKNSRTTKIQPAKTPKPKADAKPVLGEAYLETRVLETLKNQTVQDGLTLGGLKDKCKPDWLRGLAVKLGLKKPEATLTDALSFIYDLWKRGLVFAEPPARGRKAVRFWCLEHARLKFPLACADRGTQAARDSTLTQESLKTAYDKFVPDHLGGFVPVFKVRRELAAPREEFDNLLKSLNELDDPVIDLLGGDPQQYTEDQKQDSLWRGTNLFLRMRWRGI
jgi:hypothetical protein